jgi:hypothetical protein
VSPVVSVVVVVSRSTLTGSPVRESYSTSRVTVVFCVEHEAMRLMTKSKLKQKLKSLRITFLLSSRPQKRAKAKLVPNRCNVITDRPYPNKAHLPLPLLRD